jgi:hypothetical protein
VEVKPAAAAKLVEVLIKLLRVAEEAFWFVSWFMENLRGWKE